MDNKLNQVNDYSDVYRKSSFKVDFSANEFWLINILIFLSSSVSLVWSIYFDRPDIRIFAYILFIYLILRLLFKHRPPKSVELDYSINQLVIVNRLPKGTDSIDLGLISSVSCNVRPDRFPTAELNIKINDGTHKQYFFESVIYSKGFFSLPKDEPQEKLVNLVSIINKQL